MPILCLTLQGSARVCTANGLGWVIGVAGGRSILKCHSKGGQMATRLASWKTRQTLLDTSLALSSVFLEFTEKYAESVCVHTCACCVFVCVSVRAYSRACVRACACVLVAVGGGAVIEEKVLGEEDNQPSRNHQYQRTHTEADKSKRCVSVRARMCVCVCVIAMDEAAYHLL